MILLSKEEKLHVQTAVSYSCNIKEYKVRKIKHSAYNQRNCVLLYHARRFVCKDCGRTFYEPNPFVATEHSISKLTIINVLNEII